MNSSLKALTFVFIYFCLNLVTQAGICPNCYHYDNQTGSYICPECGSLVQFDGGLSSTSNVDQDNHYNRDLARMAYVASRMSNTGSYSANVHVSPPRTVRSEPVHVNRDIPKEIAVPEVKKFPVPEVKKFPVPNPKPAPKPNGIGKVLCGIAAAFAAFASFIESLMQKFHKKSGGTHSKKDENLN